MKNVARSLKIAIVLTFVFLLVEVAGGWISGSLSLLGDAGHMLRDVLALCISLAAISLAAKLPTKTKTFGYHRLEIFAAFLNGLMLILISIWIFIEAFKRVNEPEVIESNVMFIVGFIGLIVNIYVAYSLHGSHDLNVRSAFIHVVGDLLSSIAVIVAAVVIYFTDQYMIDPILGAAIGVFILIQSFKIIGESVHILLEYTPKNVDFDEVVREMEEVKGVDGVHSVHIWTLCSNINAISVHILTREPDMGNIELMKKEIKSKLQRYNIKHATLEFECEECLEGKECVVDGKINNVCH